MTRGILLLTALAAVLAVGATLGSASNEAGRQLTGTVGPGFTITLTDGDGQPVSSLRPGTYWLHVSDLSNRHNFHIFGPGLDEVVTTVPATGDVTVKLRLSHGEYTFQCDPHANTGMRGTFDVGGVGQTG
jgi:hypothetical protein